jgi:hypothetical protein
LKPSEARIFASAPEAPSAIETICGEVGIIWSVVRGRFPVVEYRRTANNGRHIDLSPAARAISSVGRASRLHREGRGFESLIAHCTSFYRPGGCEFPGAFALNAEAGPSYAFAGSRRRYRFCATICVAARRGNEIVIRDARSILASDLATMAQFTNRSRSFPAAGAQSAASICRVRFPI